MWSILLLHQVSIYASFRHRNGKVQRASMIQSVELLERSNRDRKTIDHEMISIYRRKSADIPLAVVFTLARDGKSKKWRKKWRKKIAAGGRERDDVLSLYCFSGSASSTPLAAQLAECIGERIISLRTLTEGFVVTRISHDQENHIGNIYRAFFNANECYDRAYIQVGGEGMYTVHAQVQWNQILFCLACNHKGLFCAFDVRRPAPFEAYPSKCKFPLRPLVTEKSQGERREMRKKERRPSQPQLQQRHLPCENGGRYVAVGLTRGYHRVFFSLPVALQGKDGCIVSSWHIVFLVFVLMVM